jgi:hypothetical protein
MTGQVNTSVVKFSHRLQFLGHTGKVRVKQRT